MQLDTVSLRVEILGEGMAPETAFVNIGNYIFLPVDQGKSFHPFGEEPKFDCALYLGHKELFSAPEARIRIEAQLVEPSAVPSPEGSPDWSWSTGTAASGPSWADLADGVSGAGTAGFLDSSGAFTRNAVSSDRPRHGGDRGGRPEESDPRADQLRKLRRAGSYG